MYRPNENVFLIPILFLVIINNGLNHIDVRMSVDMIPDELQSLVDIIEFHDRPRYGSDGITRYDGYAWAVWNGEHDCFHTRIDMYENTNSFVILHEVGHIYDFCVNKVDRSTEEFANEFAERYI